MPQIKASTRSLMYLGCVAVAVLLISGLLYFRQAGNLQKLQTEISKKQEELDNSEQVVRRLRRVEERYLEAQAQLGALEQGVSTKAYVPTLLRQVEDLGKESNLRVVGVRPRIVPPKPVAPPVESDDKDKKTEAEVQKPDPYQRLDMDLEIDGKYADVMKFVYEITSFPKIIAINSVQMSPEAQQDRVASPRLSVRLNATAFILKDPAPAKTDEQQKKTAAAPVDSASGGRS